MSKKSTPRAVSQGSRTLDAVDARAFSKAGELETKKITKSAAAARAYLVREGFITPKTGKLTERYRVSRLKS